MAAGISETISAVQNATQPSCVVSNENEFSEIHTYKSLMAILELPRVREPGRTWEQLN